MPKAQQVSPPSVLETMTLSLASSATSRHVSARQRGRPSSPVVEPRSQIVSATAKVRLPRVANAVVVGSFADTINSKVRITNSNAQWPQGPTINLRQCKKEAEHPNSHEAEAPQITVFHQLESSRFLPFYGKSRTCKGRFQSCPNGPIATTSTPISKSAKPPILTSIPRGPTRLRKNCSEKKKSRGKPSSYFARSKLIDRQPSSR